MSCNGLRNYGIPRVVEGNDFTLIVALKQPTLVDSETVIEDFDLSEATDVAVNIVNSLGKKTSMTYSTEGNKVLVKFDETVKAGLYGVDVTGKKDGLDWRWYAKPGEAIEIVSPSSLAYAPAGSYSVDAEIGVISLPDALIATAVEKAESAAKSAGETEESVKTAESARVEAENARVEAEKARVEAEEGRVGAEGARVEAEAARAEAEKGRVGAEEARVEAETGRAGAEEARVDAETKREQAETARVEAEAARVSEFGTIKSDAATATSGANDAASSAEAAAKSANDAVAAMASTYLTAVAGSDTTEYDDVFE